MPSDLLQTLADNHDALLRLARRAQAAPPGRARLCAFTELARLLAAHETVIERTVVPALKEFGWHGVRSDLLSRHMALKRALAETLALQRQGPAFDAAVLQVAAHLGAQCMLERDALLPVLSERLDPAQRALLAFDAEQHLIRLLGDRPGDLDGDPGPDVSDLLEEAYVVLSSLPAPEAPSADAGGAHPLSPPAASR